MSFIRPERAFFWDTTTNSWRKGVVGEPGEYVWDTTTQSWIFGTIGGAYKWNFTTNSWDFGPGGEYVRSGNTWLKVTSPGYGGQYYWNTTTNSWVPNVQTFGAFSPIKQKITANAEDVSILVIGDSTGDEVGEWVYLFATWLGAQYPTHTVRYRLWNNTTPAYGSTSNITTGSGSRIIDVYNFSVGGSRSTLIQGDRFAAGVTATDADLVIWNHGHNHVSGNQARMQGEIEGALDQVRLALPSANHAAFIQNPTRDDSTMALANTVWRAIGALWPELTLLDVYSRFIAAGKPSGWYADNVHPNATGQAEFTATIQSAWQTAAIGAYTASAAWFSTDATNLLTNGALASTGSSVPTGWTAQGTVVCAREGTIVYPGYSDCLKLTGSGAAQTLIRQILSGGSVTPLRGQYLFLTALVYVPTGADNTVGRIALDINGTGGSFNVYAGSNSARDGWMLVGIGPVLVPTDATSVGAYFYHDTDSSPDTDAAYCQRICLSVGSVPRDFA